jgi:cell division septation protein DedD
VLFRSAKAEALAAKKQAEADRKKEKEQQALEEKQKAEELAAKKKADAEAKKKQAEDDAKLAAKKKAEADAKAKEEKLAAKKKVEDEAKAKEADLAAKKKAEADRKNTDQAKTSSPDKDLKDAKHKLEEERGRAILEGENKPWMVQIAIASTQASADAMVADLRAKGYKVKTSQTSKGVRVMVGPEKGRAAADALRNQVAKDPSINAKSAWVIDWQPPTN